jgi:hypothetical protein
LARYFALFNQGTKTMKAHIIIPAIASLALFTANAASASSPTATAPQSAKVEKGTGGIVSPMSKGRMQAYEKHGQAAPVVMAGVEHGP